jgi:excisionase family DNA binding protein
MANRRLNRRLASRQGAGQYLGVSLRKIDELIKAGVLKPVRLPGCDRTLLDREDLDALVAAAKTAGR